MMLAAGDLQRTGLATTSAPGKVILLGEHAVVYGAPAIALPVTSVESRATIVPSPGGLTLAAPDLGLERRVEADALAAALALASEPGRGGLADPAALLTAALAGALQHAGMGHGVLPGWRVEVKSTVPLGGGLGSSASIAVALVRAALRAAGAEADPTTVAGLARQAEAVVHGVSSGIDPTVIAWEAPLRFQRGSHQALPVGATLDLLVAESGTTAHTGAMVARVAEFARGAPDTAAAWFQLVGQLVDKAARLMAAGDPVTLGRVLDRNHLVLQGLGVSTAVLDLLVAAARDAGAYGAKLSGAGGGGCIIALVPPWRAGEVTRALHQAGALAVHHTRLATTRGELAG